MKKTPVPRCEIQPTARWASWRTRLRELSYEMEPLPILSGKELVRILGKVGYRKVRNGEAISV